MTNSAVSLSSSAKIDILLKKKKRKEEREEEEEEKKEEGREGKRIISLLFCSIPSAKPNVWGFFPLLPRIHSKYGVKVSKTK